MPNINNPSLTSQALSAIHEEALKLLALPLSQEVEQGITLIESICRFGHDVRTEQEKTS